MYRFYIHFCFIRSICHDDIFVNTFTFLLCLLQDAKNVTLREIFVHFRKFISYNKGDDFEYIHYLNIFKFCQFRY